MNDWSQLPQELIVLIAKRLEARFDVIRFRSVCSSWRSSVPPKVVPFPIFLPPITQESQVRVIRNTFYLIRLSLGNQTQIPTCWLVRTRDGDDGVKMRLLNPLSDSELPHLPDNLPKVLDLTNFQVLELGHEYIGEYNAYFNHPIEPRYLDFRKKIVLLRASADSNDSMMIAYSSRSPGFLRSGEKEWTVLENVKGIEDIVSFNGKFYAIDKEGTTMVIDESLNVSFLGRVSSCSGYRPDRSQVSKVLVKSGDQLLAVEKLCNPYTGSPSTLGSSIRFRVFSMNEEEQKWDEIESLGGRILFLSNRQAISAPCWGRGDLIFCSNHLCTGRDYTFVFDLETGAASLLENWPAYCNLFWPPPQWVTSLESVISSTEVLTNSTHSVTYATPETEYDGSESDLAISSTANLPGRVTSAGKEVGTPSSKCSFKFCCF
ncbi:hypothetical protein V6N13_069323 [Hibiscus sabdariffa]|uniref:F-box domain-containing protein n=1 Tax=Hibiscus sabdariffa TaxID=183260 RepID=A0ABR2PGB4_9ROSI